MATERAMPSSPRRFPVPWTAEEQAACFVVRDRTRQKFAYVYFEDEPGGARSPSLEKHNHACTHAAS